MGKFREWARELELFSLKDAGYLGFQAVEISSLGTTRVSEPVVG